MATTITSEGITFNDASTLTSANITLADGSVTNAKLASNAVTVDKLGTTEQTRIAKAWVNFDGTTATIRSSFNVSSVTKNGTGDYTVNFTTAMADANYSVTIGPTDDVRHAYSLVSQAQSNFRIQQGGLYYPNGALFLADLGIVPIVVFGN